MKKPELLIMGIDGGMPSMVKQGIDQGKYPGFARLMEQGVWFEDCMTAFPSITPTCWGAICTGAVPSVNGALCRAVHVMGTKPFDYITPCHSSHVRVEQSKRLQSGTSGIESAIKKIMYIIQLNCINSHFFEFSVKNPVDFLTNQFYMV